MIFRGEPSNPPRDAYGLWYYPDINRFSDENGNILHDLSDLFALWQLEQWKKTKDYGLMVDRKGNLCELYYLEGETCYHDCDECASRCENYESWRHWESERSYIR